MRNIIDIWSKGEVVKYLISLIEQGNLKPCMYMRVYRGHATAYYPECDKDWASRIDAKNVYTDVTAYNGPSCYFWPKCPDDCPHFIKSKNFYESVEKDVPYLKTNDKKMTTSEINLFISHSSRDITFVESLIDLIRTALNIDSSKIRCTSVDGYRLPGGANTNEQLKKEVHDTTTFIGVISSDSIKSTYVVFELGARWGAGKSLIPVIAPGASATFLSGPLSGINALDATNRAQLMQLLDELATELSISLQPPSSYQRQIDKILNLKIQEPEVPTGDSGFLLNQNNYELVTTEGGAVVYKSKTEPAHFACPNCFKKEISILQDRRVVSGVFDCPKCKNAFPVKQANKVKRRVISRGI